MAAKSLLERAATRLPASKTCITCKHRKPAGEFPQYEYVTVQGKLSTRLDSRCKPCNSERRKARHANNREFSIGQCRQWREANPEKMRLSIRNWTRKYPDRVVASRIAYRTTHRDRLLRGRVISEQLRKLRKLGVSQDRRSVQAATEIALEMSRIGDKYLDAYSGELIAEPTIDHIIPLSRGGGHIYDNLCVTSKANNSSKHATPLVLWLVRKAGL